MAWLAFKNDERKRRRFKQVAFIQEGNSIPLLAAHFCFLTKDDGRNTKRMNSKK